MCKLKLLDRDTHIWALKFIENSKQNTHSTQSIQNGSYLEFFSSGLWNNKENWIWIKKNHCVVSAINISYGNQTKWTKENTCACRCSTFIPLGFLCTVSVFFSLFHIHFIISFYSRIFGKFSRRFFLLLLKIKKKTFVQYMDKHTHTRAEKHNSSKVMQS